MRWSLPGTLRDRRVTLWVWGGVLVTVTGVYVVVVLGGGLLIGHTDSPQIGLSVLATAIVALGFEPLRFRLDAAARRWLQAGRPAPYDVLSQFAESLTGDTGDTGDTGLGEQADLPQRMARL